MNTNIRSAVDTAISQQIGRVPAGYERVVEAVKVAMEGLAEQVADSLMESGKALGATEQQVRDALVDSGLIEDEPMDEVAEPADVEVRLSKIESAIESLKSLAERHLGARV